MQKLTFPPSNYAYRGDILECLSGGQHRGEFYRLTRIAMGNDTDLFGNELPTVRYGYNLVNMTTGKARQSEIGRLMVSDFDGVNNPLTLREIQHHFGMSFRVVTDTESIASDLYDVIRKHDIAPPPPKPVTPLIGSGQVVPLFATASGPVLAYVVH